MLDPGTAPVVVKIVNLFAEYGLPIISRDRIFADVKLVMDSRLVAPVDSPNSILTLDDLRREYAVCQCCGGYKQCC